MADATSTGKEAVEAFLTFRSGTYLYRRWFRRTAMVICIASLIGSYAIISESLLSQNASSFETLRACLALVIGPYMAWSCFIVARKFRELRIDKSGICIEPFGLRLSITEIDAIGYGENFAGAGKLKLTLKVPYSVFHIAAWSWGSTLSISFNSEVLNEAMMPS